MLLSTDCVLPKNHLMGFTLMGLPSHGRTHLSLASKEEWEPGNPVKAVLDSCSPKSSCNIWFLVEGCWPEAQKTVVTFLFSQ